jgi:hypothetical protein
VAGGRWLVFGKSLNFSQKLFLLKEEACTGLGKVEQMT